MCQDIHLDVCSACHPFYTGKQKMADTKGRVDRFNRRFGKRTTAAPAESEAAPSETAAAPSE